MTAPQCSASWHTFDTSAGAPPITATTHCTCGARLFPELDAPARIAVLAAWKANNPDEVAA